MEECIGEGETMKIVAEFSGGADSAAAVILAKKNYPDAKIYGIFVDYEQKYAYQECIYAIDLANKLNIGLKTIKAYNLFTETKKIKAISNVYTPLRNMLLLSIAASYAESIGAEMILTGSKGLVKIEGDPYSYYDSTVPFYKMMESVINYCKEVKVPPIIVNPILTANRTEKMSKKEVYKLLLENGIGKEDTWSCFTPDTRNILIECGHCHNCEIKKKIFEELEHERSNNRKSSKSPRE
jgi:7-cyano-7-deazaguanine synthase